MSDKDRRKFERVDTQISVDYADGETFLFSYITNISEMGIFVRSDDPLPMGTRLKLHFSLHDGTPLDIEGEVTWINPVRLIADNPNPGMGIRLIDLSPEDRERIVDAVRTIAYLNEPESD